MGSVYWNRLSGLPKYAASGLSLLWSHSHKSHISGQVFLDGHFSRALSYFSPHWMSCHTRDIGRIRSNLGGRSEHDILSLWGTKTLCHKSHTFSFFYWNDHHGFSWCEAAKQRILHGSEDTLVLVCDDVGCFCSVTNVARILTNYLATFHVLLKIIFEKKSLLANVTRIERTILFWMAPRIMESQFRFSSKCFATFWTIKEDNLLVHWPYIWEFRFFLLPKNTVHCIHWNRFTDGFRCWAFRWTIEK